MRKQRSNNPGFMSFSGRVSALTLLCVCTFMSVHLAAQSAEAVIPPLVDEDKLMALDGTRLAAMSLDDPMLRVAYAQIFLRTGDGQIQAWQSATQSDLLRRGDAATPLLLSLFEEN